VIDGAEGLRSALTKVFRGQVLIQRCHWHKRESVLSCQPPELPTAAWINPPKAEDAAHQFRTTVCHLIRVDRLRTPEDRWVTSRFKLVV
jgi:hypothetical protein